MRDRIKDNISEPTEPKVHIGPANPYVRVSKSHWSPPSPVLRNGLDMQELHDRVTEQESVNSSANYLEAIRAQMLTAPPVSTARTPLPDHRPPVRHTNMTYTAGTAMHRSTNFTNTHPGTASPAVLRSPRLPGSAENDANLKLIAANTLLNLNGRGAPDMLGQLTPPSEHSDGDDSQKHLTETPNRPPEVTPTFFSSSNASICPKAPSARMVSPAPTQVVDNLQTSAKLDVTHDPTEGKIRCNCSQCQGRFFRCKKTASEHERADRIEQNGMEAKTPCHKCTLRRTNRTCWIPRDGTAKSCSNCTRNKERCSFGRGTTKSRSPRE
jgi:hypothetical protein